ncbi:MAG: sigma-54 dependent transcriptional regulator [Deferribacterota bacterium]|nr:sigma-54 dependent transcriptional regulator [Deferribacterota bacterium]
MEKNNLLIIDDEENILWVLEEGLNDKNLIIHTSKSIVEAEKKLEKLPIKACIVDIYIDGVNALDHIKRWIRKYPDIYFVIITAYNTSSNIIESIKLGAIDIFTKPFDIGELKERLLNIFYSKGGEKVYGADDPLDNMSYDYQTRSKKMLEIYKIIGRTAKSDISVLITGETGSGKEVIARLLHNKSSRSDKPFVGINMAAIPKELIESELFGYEKGAFTGANTARIGKFEQANGGTILLDEISELDYRLQSKILRVIQDKELTRIGSNNSIKLDIRIIVATNRDMLSLVKENKFREDLYYRLNVVNIRVPPLRERKEDIPILINYFLEKYKHYREDKLEFDKEVLKVFNEYNWPGNIRELENTILFLMINCGSKLLTVDDLPSNFKQPYNNGYSLRKDLYDFAYKLINNVKNLEQDLSPYEEYIKLVEQPIIKAALDITDGNKSKAANILGLNRNTLRKKVEKYEGK